MDVKKVSHEVRLQQWERIVQECRSSGKTIKSWCEENGINIKTYYYWQRIICQTTYQKIAFNPQRKLEVVPMTDSAVFAELNISRNKTAKLAVTILHNETKIDIYSGADPSLIETALRALGNRC